MSPTIERTHKPRNSHRIFMSTMVAAGILAALMSPASLLRGVRAAPGQLDLSFAQDGSVLLPFPAELAIQPDGKIVVAYSRRLSTNVLIVERYLPSGVREWRHIIPGTFSETEFFVLKVLIRSDGRILVAYKGGWTRVGTRVVLLRQNGLIESNFGSAGNVQVPFVDVEVMSNNRLITLDSNSLQVFNGKGELVETVSLTYPTPPGAGRLAVGPDGRVIVASTSLLTRYNADLTPDSGFCGSGTCSSPLSLFVDKIIVTHDGKIVTAGGHAIARHLPNGEIDTAFGASGVFNVIPFEVSTGLAGMRADDTGRIVIAENGFYGTSMIRVIDVNGLTTETVTSGSPLVDFALQTDGKIVVSGFIMGESHLVGGLRRYHYTDERKQADLRFATTKITPKSGINRGDEIEYAISVVNDGPDKAGHVTFENPLSHGTSFVSFDAPPGWVIYERPGILGAGKISCSRYGLAPGAMETLHLTVRVKWTTPQGAQIINTSTVNSLVFDPVQSNNTTTATVTVH